MAKKLTVNRQKRNIFTVNHQIFSRQISQQPRSQGLSLNLGRGPPLSQEKGPGNEVDFSDILKKSRPSSYAVNK